MREEESFEGRCPNCDKSRNNTCPNGLYIYVYGFIFIFMIYVGKEGGGGS